MGIHERVSMLTAEECAQLLGLGLVETQELLQRRGLESFPEGRERLYSCVALEALLPPRYADRLRRAAAAQGWSLRAPEGTVYGHPELGPFWHRRLNKGLKPWRLGYASTLVVWWKCPEGPDHEWKREISVSLQKGRWVGCPFCDGKRVSITNCLATKNPAAARQWHPTRNGDLKPTQVIAGSHQVVWWRCVDVPEHEWEAEVAVRAVSSGQCLFCERKRASATSSLAAVDPQIAAQWHPTLNGELTPEDVVSGTGRIVWWKCPVASDHVWRASVKNRTRVCRGCPFCAKTNRRVSRGINLATTHPALAREWHPTKNGELVPSGILAGSAKRVWWRCENGHEWQSTPNKRTAGQGPDRFRECPYCAGRRVTKGNSLADLYPQVAAEWHPERNEALSAKDVRPGARNKVWWRCSKGHEWEAMVRNRAYGSTCPYCSGHKVAREDTLAQREPELAEQWHPTKNGELTPWMVGGRSGRIVWWRCPAGKHEWKASVGYRLRRKHPLVCTQCHPELVGKGKG